MEMYGVFTKTFKTQKEAEDDLSLARQALTLLYEEDKNY